MIMPRMRDAPFNRLSWLAMLTVMTIGVRAHAQDVDPAYHFQTLRTDHFVIHFHQHAEPLAADLGEIAEATWRDVAARSDVRPPARTHVVLTDQSDSANGFATTLPRNTIVLYAVAPTGSDRLNPRDWLRTVFVHEFAHVVHLDRSKGWVRIARGVFGRTPWAFPNLTLPAWQIEGLATWEESETPGIGRLHAGDFQAVVKEAARAGRLEPIDRVGGGLTDWPGGLASYAYGLGFHEYLSKRYGAHTLTQLSDATARSLPWLGSLAFKRVYGASLGTLWRDYLESLDRDVSMQPEAERASVSRRLTHRGHVVTGPRYMKPACEGCATEVTYSIRTPHERPALYRIQLDTLDETRLTTRILGSTTGTGHGGTIYFDQQELHRNVGLYGDLYSLDRATGRVDRLTSGARLSDPDLSPDGRTIVAVQNRRPGRRDLILIDVEALRSSRITRPDDPVIQLLRTEPHTQFNAPRLSPDGRLVVAERQQDDRPSDLVIVDVAAGGSSRRITSNSDVRWITPTWRPDGRAIVAAASKGDGPFNLYEISIDDGRVRALTSSTGGATWPDVSPDGSRIVYVAYSADGFDLYEMPYTSSAEAPGHALDSEPLSDPAADAAITLTASAYRPWPTLLPTSWTPLIESTQEQVRIGAATSGVDVLGYHAYGVAATWPIATRIRASHLSNVPDWNVSYTYRRWTPQLWIETSRDTSFLAGTPTDEGLATPSTLIERTAAAGVQWPVTRVRFSHVFQASLVHATDVRRRDDIERFRNRSAMRTAWRFSSAQRPGYAISPERGATIGTAAEFVRRTLGASANATTVTADARAYLRGFGAHHVVAARVAGGTTRGDTNVSRIFLLGGGSADAVVGTLGSEGMNLLRGFGANTFAGTSVGLINLDYRWPIARPQRGIGAWPFFLHTLHAALVADAGHAWSGRFNTNDIKTSFGGELSANLVLGYFLPVTVTVGAARGFDGSRAVKPGVTAYARVGYAF